METVRRALTVAGLTLAVFVTPLASIWFESPYKIPAEILDVRVIAKIFLSVSWIMFIAGVYAYFKIRNRR